MPSGIEEVLRSGLHDLGSTVDVAPDLDQRIQQRRAARRHHLVQRSVVGVAVGAVVVVLVGVLAVSGAHSAHNVVTGSATTTAASVPGPPRQVLGADIAGGRFVATLDADGGSFIVTPARPGEKPQLTQDEARVVAASDMQGLGWGQDIVLAFGQVSVVAPGWDPGVRDVPAWVGFVRQRSYGCVAMTVPPQPPTTLSGTIYPEGFIAVIVEGDGSRVFDYTSRSTHCSYQVTGPSLSAGVQVVSIPWQLVSLDGQIVTFRYQLPGCVTSPEVAGMTVEPTGRPGEGHIGVSIKVPFSATYDEIVGCGGTWETSTVAFGVPKTQPITTVLHDPTGPVGALPSTQLQPTTSVSVKPGGGF